METLWSAASPLDFLSSWLIAVLMAIQQLRPPLDPAGSWLDTVLFIEVSRCFCTVGPLGGKDRASRHMPRAPTCLMEPRAGSLHFQKLRDTAVRKAGLAPARSMPCEGVPCLGSDLHRLVGRLVPACCVSVRPVPCWNWPFAI